MVKGGSCMVAELQPAGDGTGATTLLCYTMGEHKWVEKRLSYSPPLHENWCGEGVVSDGVMLWWVDLVHGLLLACDPFSDKPELLHVLLPPVLDQIPVKPANSGAYRCVRMSVGRLRYVVIHDNMDAPVVSTWALTDLTSDVKWNPERSIPLAEIWADESYLNAMLPWSIPALAILHPADPDTVYFFLELCIFAVDLRRKKVVEFSEFVMPDPPDHFFMRSSHLVHAWKYDPSSNQLRQAKDIAAHSRLINLLLATRKTAKRVKRFRDVLIKEQQEAMKLPEWLKTDRDLS